MIVFDLICAGAGHVFEGWFGSSNDYEQQKSAGLLSCPVCGTGDVTKAVMAPAVSPKSNQNSVRFPMPSGAAEGSPVSSGDGGGRAANEAVPMRSEADTGKVVQLLQALAQAQSEALSKSEWVGRRFADKARAMHYGEEDPQAIHGEVDPQVAQDLIEEGVDVAPLLFPVVPPKARN